MHDAISFKKISMLFCLTAALCLAFFASAAMADDTLVTWEFKKAEEVDGKLKVSGTLTNNTEKVVTHIVSRSWRYTQNGKLVERSSEKPLKITKPMQPGGQSGLNYTLNDTSEVSDFTVTIREVMFAEGEPAAPAPKASKEDLDKIGLTFISSDVTLDGAEYHNRVGYHNNSDKLVRTLKVTLTQKYRDGDDLVQTRSTTFPNGIPPGRMGSVTYKTPTRNGTGESTGVKITDVKFEPYEEPEREYGPKKGNILWTVDSVKADKKGYLVLQTNILNNNVSEDIVAFNTYTVSFDHAGGKYVSPHGVYSPPNPLNAQAKMVVNLRVNHAGAFKNVRNVKITDVTYMTRPASARPKPAASSGGGGGGGGGNYSIRFLDEKPQEKNGAFILRCEILNNSSTLPLVRLDNATINFEGTLGAVSTYSKYNHSLGTLNVNIPPLGTKRMSFTFAKGMTWLKNIRFSATPRFGQEKKQSDTKTVIIKER